MMLKYYLKHAFFAVYTKKNVIKFSAIFLFQILIQLYFILNLFQEEKVIDSASLAFSTEYNTPYRLFSNIPRAVIFDKNSEYSNLGNQYYRGIKNAHNLTNLQFFSNNLSEVDKVFLNDFNQGLDNLTAPSTRFTYYNWRMNNNTFENNVSYYTTVLNFKKYDKFDLRFLPIDSYVDSFPLLLNEFLAHRAYNNSNFQYQVFNFFKKMKIINPLDSLSLMKIYNDYLSYINLVTKKIFDFSLFYISQIFVDILFNERKNNTFYALELYNFSRFYHFIGNLIPFLSIITVNSLAIACLYCLMLKNTSLIYIIYMLITIQFCQYIYFYTIVSILKKRNIVKMKIMSLIVFLINLLFSLADKFTYTYIFFPPFFMRVLNNYFFDSMFYYSQIEKNYIFQMTIFLLFWISVLTVYLEYFMKLKNICSKRGMKNGNIDSQSKEINFEINLKSNKNNKDNVEINPQTIIVIKRNRINLITGDNHSGKSGILRQIMNKISKRDLLYVLTKRKGLLYNLTIKENIEILMLLLADKKINRSVIGNSDIKICSNEILLINPQEERILDKNKSDFISMLESENNPGLIIDSKGLQRCKLSILLHLIKDSSLEREFIILDQPFIKLSKSECSELIRYLELFDKTFIISSNYKPDNNNIEVVLETKNYNYSKNAIGNHKLLSDSTENEGEIRPSDDKGIKDNNVDMKKKMQDKKIFKDNICKTLKYIIIFLVIFALSIISFYYNSVNIDDPGSKDSKNNNGFDKLYIKEINEPLDNIYLSDDLNRNSSLYSCLSQSVNLLSKKENEEYLSNYFNKSVIFDEHAVLVDISFQAYNNKTYVNFFVYSRPIDTFKNLQLSAIIGDCLINDLNPQFKIKTNIEIRHMNNESYTYRNMIIDVQLLFINLIYFILLLKILDKDKNYLKDTLIYSSIVILLICFEFYIAEIPFYKNIFLPKLFIYTLCCNLMKYTIKQFFIGILIANSGCLIIYVYYAVVYLANFFWKFNLMNNEVICWIMLILESISPYNRILFYKPIAFLPIITFSLKEQIAKTIFDYYKTFYASKTQDTAVAVCLCLSGLIFWSINYIYLLRKLKEDKKRITKDFELKRSNDYFKFSSDLTIRSLSNAQSETFKYLCLDPFISHRYSSLSYSLKNKVLLNQIGWEYLESKNDSDSFVIKNKEQVEIHFDEHTKNYTKRFFKDDNNKDRFDQEVKNMDEKKTDKSDIEESNDNFSKRAFDKEVIDIIEIEHIKEDKNNN